MCNGDFQFKIVAKKRIRSHTHGTAQHGIIFNVNNDLVASVGLYSSVRECWKLWTTFTDVAVCC